MASERGVRAALTMLGRVFAGSVGPERVEAYGAALGDLTDDELAAAAAHLMQTHAGEFIPVPAVIRRTVRGDETPKLDVDRIIREIDRMGTYTQGGWSAPGVQRVRDAMGSAIADAYGDVGPSRLLAEDQRTRDIAAQEFRRALKATTPAGYAAFPPWALANPPRLAASERKRLIPGEG